MRRSDKSDGTCLLVRWQASYRRQELYPGSIMELENLHGNAIQHITTSDGKVFVEGKRTLGTPQGGKPMYHVGVD